VVQYNAQLEKEMKPIIKMMIGKIFNKRGFCDRVFDFEELTQVSKFLLYEACMEYDETKGARFSTFYYMKLRNRLRSMYRNITLRQDLVPITLHEDEGSVDWGSITAFDCQNMDPSEAIIEMIDIEKMNSMLEPDEKEFYQMRHFEGHSVSSIIKIKKDTTSPTMVRKKVNYIKSCHGELVAHGSKFC